MKITPTFFSSSLKVVATETLSNTASTATRLRGASTSPSSPTSPSGDGSRTMPSSASRSRSGMPSFS